uniref:Metal tolerance protein C3 n=1 Tax=Cajanus cajan TaxID=3821 RepID=A0A151RLD1_CAJCA|nr:Putative metal tolerance protein C3 [Cajanus cajan]
MNGNSGSMPLLGNQNHDGNSFNTLEQISCPSFLIRSVLASTLSLLLREIKYYERQFATLKSFEEVDSIVTSDCTDVEDIEKQAQHERAMKISNFANAALLALKIYVTIRSGSIAVAASTLDSLLDFMAGGILWFTHLAMKDINMYKYPIGKLRVQPVGIIIFAAVMATLGFQVFITAVQQLILIENNPSEKMSYDQLAWLYSIMIFATLVKLRKQNFERLSQHLTNANLQDHHFDVVTNVIGLVAAVLGDKFYWWIDPVGAILLSIYTITNWSGTVMENAVGQSAPPEVLQKLTYLVVVHSQIKRIDCGLAGPTIDTVRAYTFDFLYFVEIWPHAMTKKRCYNFGSIDIELQEDLPLKEANAIGESLQIKLEKLAEVERAFVHLDFECDHKPEHSVLSKLPDSHP